MKFTLEFAVEYDKGEEWGLGEAMHRESGPDLHQIVRDVFERMSDYIPHVALREALEVALDELRSKVE